MALLDTRSFVPEFFFLKEVQYIGSNSVKFSLPFVVKIF